MADTVKASQEITLKLTGKDLHVLVDAIAATATLLVQNAMENNGDYRTAMEVLDTELTPLLHKLKKAIDEAAQL